MTTIRRAAALALVAALTATTASAVETTTPSPAPPVPAATGDPCAEGLRLLRQADLLALRELGAPRFGLVGAPGGAAARAYEEAAAAFAVVIAGHPDLAEAYAHLFACHRGRGRYDLARATLAPLRGLDAQLAKRLAAELADSEGRTDAANGQGGC